MTPYLLQQLLYLSLAGALAWGGWAAIGRLRGLRERPRLRLLATALALSSVLPAFALARAGGLASFFGAVALGFYWGSVWLPSIALAEVVRQRRRGLGVDRVLAAAGAILVLTGAYALLVEPNRLQVVERTVRFEAWPESAPPLRIAHVSDLQTVGACARERRAAEIINAWEPDLIVITGDYAAGPFGDPEPAIAAARAFLGSLRARHGIVCVAGHSETEAIRLRVFEGLGVRYLRNEEIEIDLSGAAGERRISIFGARAHGADLSLLEERGDRREPGLVRLFVSHVPDLTRRIDGLGIDLHLAGHTHGGQIAVPFLGPPVLLSGMPRRFARGLHRFGDHWIHVSPGIGMEGDHAPRIRFLCPPEIDFLLLEGGRSEPLERERS